jgi:hypothetical protein
LPDTVTAPEKGAGGPAYHKNPNCPCNACKSRRRKAEARPGPAGESLPVPTQQPSTATALAEPKLHADLPVPTRGTILRGPDRTIRGRVAQWLEFRAADPSLKNGEIAKRLGVAEKTLNAYIHQATTEGWLQFDDAVERVEHEIVPKALTGLSELLDAKDPKAIIETAKGAIFPMFKEAKGVHDGANKQTIIAIRFETIDHSHMSSITGNIVGAPRVIDVEAESVTVVKVGE